MEQNQSTPIGTFWRDFLVKSHLQEPLPLVTINHAEAVSIMVTANNVVDKIKEAQYASEKFDFIQIDCPKDDAEFDPSFPVFTWKIDLPFTANLHLQDFISSRYKIGYMNFFKMYLTSRATFILNQNLQIFDVKVTPILESDEITKVNFTIKAGLFIDSFPIVKSNSDKLESEDEHVSIGTNIAQSINNALIDAEEHQQKVDELNINFTLIINKRSSLYEEISTVSNIGNIGYSVSGGNTKVFRSSEFDIKVLNVIHEKCLRRFIVVGTPVLICDLSQETAEKSVFEYNFKIVVE